MNFPASPSKPPYEGRSVIYIHSTFPSIVAGTGFTYYAPVNVRRVDRRPTLPERKMNQQLAHGTHFTEDYASNKLEVCWLPSLPLTRKHKAPPVSGIGVLYSEELDRILQVFDTDNLKESVKGFSRDQAAAFNIDPNCRLHWVETSDAGQQTQFRIDLLAQMQADTKPLV